MEIVAVLLIASFGSANRLPFQGKEASSLSQVSIASDAQQETVAIRNSSEVFLEALHDKPFDRRAVREHARIGTLTRHIYPDPFLRPELSSYHFGMAASTVVVASTAAMKVGAVKRLLGEGFEAAGGRVQGVKAASGINEQPFGHEETILGAKNRLASAKTLAPDANFYVAIENGIFEVKTPESKFYDVAWVIMENSRGQQALTHSVGIEFPAKWVLEAREEGFDKTHAGHKFAADNPGANVQDPHQLLTAGRACREDLLHGALLAAWGQLQYKSAHGMT